MDEVQTGVGRTGTLWGYENTGASIYLCITRHSTTNGPPDINLHQRRRNPQTHTQSNDSGVEPDVFTSAKALGAGVPIGAMMCKVRPSVGA